MTIVTKGLQSLEKNSWKHKFASVQPSLLAMSETYRIFSWRHQWLPDGSETKVTEQIDTQMEGAGPGDKKVSRLLTFGLLALSWVIWLQPWNINEHVGFDCQKPWFQLIWFEIKAGLMPKTKGPGKTGRMTPLGSVCLPPISYLCLSLFVNHFATNKARQWLISLNTSHTTKSRKVEKVQDNSRKKNKYDLWIVLGIGELTCCLFAPAIHFDSRIVSG